jgi:hypothetical protein
MKWTLVVKDSRDLIVFGPEIYPAGFLAYREAHKITNGEIDLTHFTHPNAIDGGRCFSLQIYLTLESNERVLFMEKRGVAVKNETDIGLRWVERPDTETPFRVTIKPDYCAYAWDEYGMTWSVSFTFPENPIVIELDKDFLEWLSIFKNTDIDERGHPIISFSWEEFHKIGLALAKRLKLLGKDDIVVFYEKPYEDTSIIEDIQLIRIDESV